MATPTLPDRSNRPKPQASALPGKRLWFLAPLFLGGLGLLFWSRSSLERQGEPETASSRASRAHPRGGPASGPEDLPEKVSAPGKGPPPGTVARPEGETPEQQRQRELELWMRRLERTQDTLDKYLVATKYPPDSRPLSEHPDQVRPNDPITGKRPLTHPPTPDSPQIRTRQDRVYVVGEEVVRFALSAETATGAPLPLTVVSAMAAQPPDDSLPPPTVNPVPIAFRDDGQAGDDAPDDGTFTASFQPAKQGFGQYHGPIRLEVQLRVGNDQGTVKFDLLYTPAPPAAFTGAVREVLENGSLSLYLGVSIQKPGRYVVTGRVDDARGTPFALVNFNDEVGAGPGELKLTIFGKLVKDQKPVFPLKLRDVDGFLLQEDAYPDRELMGRLAGYFYATRVYPETVFSDAEWQSEERDRYVTELTKDMKQAQKEVDARKR